MRTQWRIIAGMSGAHHQGLDYTALYGHPKFARLDYDAQDKLLCQVQHIEAGALAAKSDEHSQLQDEADERHRVTRAILDRQIADQEALLRRMRRARDFTPDGRLIA